jgi:L-arabinose isomerase
MSGKTNEKVKIGIFSVGLDTYWGQFGDLLEELTQYLRCICTRIGKMNAVLINAGMVDDPVKARQAAYMFKKENVEMIFVFVSTYALSSTVLPVAQIVKTPFVILNLQPGASIDFAVFNDIKDRGIKTGKFLAYCQSCSVPEITGVLKRAGIKCSIVTGHLHDEETWERIEGRVDAARVAKIMRNNRVGILGHYYCGMLDVYSDLTKQSATFGNHFEILEMDELKLLWDNITDKPIERKIEQFHKEFDVSAECSFEELHRAARTSCALDGLVEQHNLGSLAYYYEGSEGSDNQNIISSVIAGNSLLTAHHVPVAGEYEIKNVQAMKILDSFNAGGSFSEFYTIDYNDDLVLLGHDGPAHFAIAEKKVGLVPLPVYHGKPGAGLSIQMTVKHGPVTVLAVAQEASGNVCFVVAEGESVPGPVLDIGNTNSRYRFAAGAGQFVDEWSKAGPSHHCAIGIGHIARKIENLAEILEIRCIRVG